MRPRSEGEMPVWRARDVERLGLVKLRWVAVCSPDAERNERSLRYGNIANRCVLDDSSVAELVGAFKTQNFFDRCLDRGWVLDQPLPLFRKTQQKLEPVADEVCRRFMTCIQNEDAVVEKFDLIHNLQQHTSQRGVN